MKSTNVNLNWMSGFLIRKNAHRQMKRKYGDRESFIMREPLSRRFVDWGLQQYCLVAPCRRIGIVKTLLMMLYGSQKQSVSFYSTTF